MPIGVWASLIAARPAYDHAYRLDGEIPKHIILGVDPGSNVPLLLFMETPETFAIRLQSDPEAPAVFSQFFGSFLNVAAESLAPDYVRVLLPHEVVEGFNVGVF